MNPEKAIAVLIFLGLVLVCGVCAALGFNSWLQVQESLKREEYADRMVAAVEGAVEKIPEFKLFKRKDDKYENPRYKFGGLRNVPVR
jgi:hypothetical protein